MYKDNCRVDQDHWELVSKTKDNILSLHTHVQKYRVESSHTKHL